MRITAGGVVEAVHDGRTRLVVALGKQEVVVPVEVRGTDEPRRLDFENDVIGPSTVTHGGMAYGAGYVAATEAQAAEIIDPREAADATIAAIYAQYPHIGRVLPAVGYHPAQLKALARTINRSDVDLVVSGTPCDLAALVQIDKPVVRARYEYADADTPGLEHLVEAFLAEQGLIR